MSFAEMSIHMDQLDQIANNIEQADANDAKGLKRIHLSMAIALLQKFMENRNKEMLSLESIGEETKEVHNFAHMPDFHSVILDL